MAKDLDQYKQAVGDKIVQALSDEIFTVDGTPTLCYKFPDGKFKNQPGIAGAEFMVESAYIGKRGNLNFVFQPVDANDYQIHVELNRMDASFPLFASKLGEAVGIDSERADFVVKKMLAQERQAAEEAKEAAETAEATRAANAYKNNPLFGAY